SPRSVVTCPMSNFFATSRVLSSSRPTSETTSTPSLLRMPSMCLTPNAPAPASATLIVFIAAPCPFSPKASALVLEDQVPDRRVRRGHVVEAVNDLRWLAARDVGHRAARDQPHHQLDALGAGLANVVDVRHGRQSLRIGDQPVEEGVVELAVDQPGARPLQLVAHAAGAPDLHLQRFVV